MISSRAERSDHLSPRFSASAPRDLWEDSPWSRGLFPAPDDTQILSHPLSLHVPDAMVYPGTRQEMPFFSLHIKLKTIACGAKLRTAEQRQRNLALVGALARY